MGKQVSRQRRGETGRARTHLSLSTISIPKKGKVADPGFCGVAPGRGETMMPPVSVCQYVSTIEQRFLPTTVAYHVHACEVRLEKWGGVVGGGELVRMWNLRLRRGVIGA